MSNLEKELQKKGVRKETEKQKKKQLEKKAFFSFLSKIQDSTSLLI
jgi:hypothetical protein